MKSISQNLQPHNDSIVQFLLSVLCYSQRRAERSRCVLTPYEIKLKALMFSLSLCNFLNNLNSYICSFFLTHLQPHMPAVSFFTLHALSLLHTQVSVNTPSPGQEPYLAFPSALPAVRPRAVWIALAGSEGCSRTALCTETNGKTDHVCVSDKI